MTDTPSRTLRRELARSHRRVQLARIRRGVVDTLVGAVVAAAYAVARAWDRVRHG